MPGLTWRRHSLMSRLALVASPIRLAMLGADVRGGREEDTASVNLMTFPPQDIATHSFPIWPLMLLLAPVIGSFLGVLIRRLPCGHPVVFARSACESCRTVLTARDMVPLVSYGLQRG